MPNCGGGRISSSGCHLGWCHFHTAPPNGAPKACGFYNKVPILLFHTVWCRYNTVHFSKYSNKTSYSLLVRASFFFLFFFFLSLQCFMYMTLHWTMLQRHPTVYDVMHSVLYTSKISNTHNLPSQVIRSQHRGLNFDWTGKHATFIEKIEIESLKSNIKEILCNKIACF